MSKQIQPMLQSILDSLDDRLSNIVLCFEKRTFEEVDVYGIFKKKKMVMEHKTYTLENGQTVFIVTDEFDGMELNEIKYLDSTGKLLYITYPNQTVEANTILTIYVRNFECRIN